MNNETVIIEKDELLQTTFAPQHQILGPWLLNESINMIYGWRGVGKTYFSLKCAHAIASGSPFLKWPTQSRRVLYIDGEMGLRALKTRIQEIEQGSIRANQGMLEFLSLDRCDQGVIWNLADYRHQPKYTEACKNFDVIFIDNIASVCRLDGREMEDRCWARVQTWALTQRIAGKALVFIHHAGKGGQQRGVSNREDAMNQVIKLAKTPLCQTDRTEFEIEFEKTRDIWGKDAESLICSLKSTPEGLSFSWDTREQKLKWRIVALKSSGCNAREIADTLLMQLAEVKEILDLLGGTNHESADNQPGREKDEADEGYPNGEMLF